MSEASPEAAYRRPGRPGIRQSDVDRAADALLRSGKKPTIETVRGRTGGSTQSLTPMLDHWWQRLFARMQLAEPAFQKLPGALPELAEAFFLCAVDEAAKVAAAKREPDRAVLEGREREVEVRVHALRLAEQALRERHERHAGEIGALHSQLRELTLLLRKTQSSREALEQRVRELEALAGRKSSRRRLSVKPSATPTKKRKTVAASKPRRADRSGMTVRSKRSRRTDAAKQTRRG